MKKKEELMKISKIECIPVMIKYKRPSVMGRRVIPGSEPVIVKIHTDEGIVGIAEAGHASLGYIGEGQDSVMGIINNLFGPEILLGQDPRNIEKLVNRMYRMTKHNNAAITVIDYALHDIVGKKLEVPVYQLLGGLSNPKIPLGMVISFGDMEFVVRKAREIKNAGFKSIKLKHGTVEQDIANIKAVREAVGPEMRLGIDINGGYDYFEALGALKKMEQYDLFMCEQPVPFWDIDGMARLRQQVRVPICADESAADISQVLQVIKKNAADVLFIKVAKVGGLIMAQKWVAIAQAADIPVMCGCLVGSGFEAAAQAHLLAANDWMNRLEHENNGPLHMHDRYDTVKPPITDDLAKNPPRYEDGYLYPPTGPGLGMELNEDLMKELITPGKTPTMIELKK
jgi:L-alanine-DL-glutamate epimerase-like enolase superfamily enzyme